METTRAGIAIYKINYQSDFILTVVCDVEWGTPFCIKFWTGEPSQAYYVGWTGHEYKNCKVVESDPSKLLVLFDDHHLPVGELKMQIAYHTTIEDFPNAIVDEVTNSMKVMAYIDGKNQKIALDFEGEEAAELQFELPAYANEAQRIANEELRIANEQARIEAEQQRIDNEQTRQDNEAQRIAQETARVNEYAELKADAVAATDAANDAATLANQKAQLAADKAALADAAATLANQKAQLAADKAALADSAATLANQKAEYADAQGDYAKEQGDYAKEQGDTALADHRRAESDHETAASDHTIAANDHTQAGNDHTRAESDHSTAADDHTLAASDHSTAAADHTLAASDHSTAADDHTLAASDHSTAANDHTQAGNDHTRAESDHTRAESDHAAVEVYVDSLGAFDISSYHATGGVLAKYADLTAALGTGGANIPEAIRKGGMSVKFVQSSDNKYVQCRYMSSSTAAADFANVANWQGVDDEPTAGSKNLVESGGVAAIVDGKITEKPSIWSTGNNIVCRLANAQYISMSGFVAKMVPINGGETVYAKGKANGSTIAIVKTWTEAATWTNFDFATGISGTSGVPKNNSTTFTCPSDARYLIVKISINNEGGDAYVPAEMTINGVDVFNPLPSELSTLNTKVAHLEDAVYPEKVTWCDDSEMNDVIEEMYIPNASTFLGSGSYINVLTVGTDSLSFIVKDSGGNEIVRMNKAFYGSIDHNPDGSYDYYFGRKGKAAISTIYKKNSNDSLLQRIGYIKLKDTTFAKTSTGAATLDLTNISNIDNSPIIKKMVNDGRQVILSGDSHFGAFKGVNILQDLLQGELGVQVYNIGFGGCRMAWREAAGANGYDAYTFCDVVDAIVDGSFTKQEANVDLSNDYPPSVANLEAIDTTKPMLFLVEYCVNDHWGNSPIGDVYEDDGTFDVSDDTEVATKLASFDRTTLLGALNYGLLKLYANNPKSLWVQVTGGARVIDNPDTQGRRMRYNRQNSLGKTLDDYNKALADDCNNIGIRYANYPNNGLYNAFAMREGDEGITTDGSIHNNALGFSYMSKVIADMLRYYLGLN